MKLKMFSFILSLTLSITLFSCHGNAAVPQSVQDITTSEDWCQGCPKECFVWCIKTRNDTSPCQTARDGLSNDNNCKKLQCVDHHCGMPTALFCNNRDSLNRQCLADPFNRLPVGSRCWNWLESQCRNVSRRRPVTQGLVRPARPIKPVAPSPPNFNRCPDCPFACGDLCRQVYAIMSPCSVAQYAPGTDANTCKADNCQDSYCSSPFAYFCTNSQTVDLSCTKDRTALQFINHNNGECRNWFMSLCNNFYPENSWQPRPLSNLTPGQPKERPTTPHALRPPRNFRTCEDDCPEECGLDCRKIDAAFAPCMLESTRQCPNNRCKSFFCGRPFALFCDAQNQVDADCTNMYAAAHFLNSTNPICRDWLQGKCPP